MRREGRQPDRRSHHLARRPKPDAFFGQQAVKRSTPMDPKDANALAARNLTKDATLEELREAARDLRALSPDSALAELVEAKIESILGERESED